MTKARDIADFKFENITDTGTEGTKVATGTTAQRGSTQGQWRFNTTTGFFEGRNANAFSTLEPTPTIASVDVTEVDSQSGGDQTIVVTGTNFTAGGTITFVGNSGADFNASTTTYNSATQVTAVAPKASFLNAQEPYKVKFASSSGVAGISANGLINVDTSPSWQTASGTLATITDANTGTHATVSATDADGDTVAYSVQSGSLPAGTSLNTSTGVISGDPTNITNSTTSNFTLRATANSKTVDRAFSIIVNPANDGSTSARAFSTMSDIAGLYTGHQTLYTTLGGNLSTPIQVKVDCSTTGGAWIIMSFAFGTGGLNATNDTVFHGGQDSNHAYSTSGSGRLYRSLDLGLGEGSAVGYNVFGENITDNSNSITTYGGVSAATHGNTSFYDIDYYNHATQANFTDAEMTAMRAFVTSMYTSIPHVAIECDSSDGGGNYDFTTAYNSQSQQNKGHITLIKNAQGTYIRPQVRKNNTDEHWSAGIWTHNTWSEVNFSGQGFRESLSTTGDPSSTGLGVGANGWLFPVSINYGNSTGGGASFGTPKLTQWSNGAGGTGNVLNSRAYFLVKG